MASPDIRGNWEMETHRQESPVEATLDMAFRGRIKEPQEMKIRSYDVFLNVECRHYTQDDIVLHKEAAKSLTFHGRLR